MDEIEAATEALRHRANALRRGIFIFWTALSVVGLIITITTGFKAIVLIFPIIPAVVSGLRFRGGGTIRRHRT